ncbi:unnamed protein product [Diamesa tonsa]
MESSTPPASNDVTVAQEQDPLALPDETSVLYGNGNDNSSSSNISSFKHPTVNNIEIGEVNITVTSKSLSDKENSDSLINENIVLNGVYNNDGDKQPERCIDEQQRMQSQHFMESERIISQQSISHNFDNDTSTDPQKLNLLMQHQNHHLHIEPHKSFSHSIENLTTEKGVSNDIKIFPNLLDSHEQYDDGYETGVGDLLSNNKYKLPSLPPPSSSPYSSLSSSSISTISTANSTPTNLLNTQQQQQQQQSPSYLGGRVKINQHVATPEDPYRFVDDEISNGINSHSNAMMHSLHHQMSPAGMSSNYSASSSPMPQGQIQQQMIPTAVNTMMQFNEHVPLHHHHHQQHGHHHQLNHQQTQPQHMSSLVNGNLQTSENVSNANPMMINNDAPKKRGRKKKQRDENGNPIEDRPSKERKKHDRFNGMPEEEVTKRILPDHLTNNLDIVIVGINPGLFAAYKGHHYAGPGNHFWKCLYLSGLTSVQMTAEEDYKLLQYGIGFTNMVQRPTKGSADLTRKEIKEGSRVLLEKIRKFQPKIAVFNGKLIFEVFSGKKDFCFGKQPEPVEGTNTYMWVMPSSSARCAQLPRAADKVPFYAALKKFRDYLNGLVPDYDDNEYVFNDPKYNNISTETELKAESLAFTSLDGDIVGINTDSNKKKRGRPKKVRGENGEEVAPSNRRQNSANQDVDDLDPNKKKRGRPKKSKDISTNTGTKKKNINSNNNNNNINNNNNSNSNSNSNNNANSSNHSNNHAFLPSMSSPSTSNYHPNNNNSNNNNNNNNHNNNGANNTMMSHHAHLNQQQSHPMNHPTQQQTTSPMNLCYSSNQIPAPSHPDPHQQLSPVAHQLAYQQQLQRPQAQAFGVISSGPSGDISSEISAAITSEHMASSSVPVSPSLAISNFESSQAAHSLTSVDSNITAIVNGRNSSDVSLFPQSQSLDTTSHLNHNSPLTQIQSPVGVGMYSQLQQHQQLTHLPPNNNSPYSPYQRHHHPQQQSYHLQHQTPPSTPVNKQQMLHAGATDSYKDVATKSLSGLESLVDQIPSISDQENMIPSGARAVSLMADGAGIDDPYVNLCIFSGYQSSSSGTMTTPSISSTVATPSASSVMSPLAPQSHHPHYGYSSANQSPYTANPFSVSSLTSSSYPSAAAAAAMNSYHQNLMGNSHLTSSFMEPHMPVPVAPSIYHSYQQHSAAGYPGYPPHPPSLHMPNYPYYSNTGYSQAPASSYHSMFDRINF